MAVPILDMVVTILNPLKIIINYFQYRLYIIQFLSWILQVKIHLLIPFTYFVKNKLKKLSVFYLQNTVL